MHPFLYTVEDDEQSHVHALESGQILYLPQRSFQPAEREKSLLCESILDPHHKNISYHITKDTLAGLTHTDLDGTKGSNMRHMMKRYAHFAKDLIDSMLPQYSEHVIWGRTSYRPAEIKGRITSKRKDDTRLHVDAFPSSPVQGKRILRVFSNINPAGQPRVWHVGEPLIDVIQHFQHTIPVYRPTLARCLQLLKITKTYRTLYDHQMLHLHDNMKCDEAYQKKCNHIRIDFPAYSTWIVFTDQVSHAALSGQHLLEHTFYLPIEAMEKPETSPLKQWENVLNASRGCVNDCTN